MEVGDWITLVAVLVALGIGIASILHTQSLQKKERRERLLNEIIEWATDIAKCEFSINIQEPSPIFSRLCENTSGEYQFRDKQKLLEGIMLDHKRFWLNHYMNLHRNYQSLGTKGEYILGLSDTEYFQNIINNVRIVKAQADEYEGRLWEYIKDIDNESNKEKLRNKATELHTSAIELITVAAKIKAKI